MTERTIETLTEMLRVECRDGEWDEHLGKVLWAYNSMTYNALGMSLSEFLMYKKNAKSNVQLGSQKNNCGKKQMKGFGHLMSMNGC